VNVTLAAEALASSTPVTTATPTLSTTTSPQALARVRGFTEDLLHALKQGGLRTRDICEKTQKPNRYVSRYLWNMRKYGLVMKNASFWNLTVLGIEFTTYIEEEKNRRIEVRNLNERRTKDTQNLHETILQKVEFQSRFDLWLQNSGLSDVEKGVVDYLVSHYNKTKQKFILVASRYELAEQLHVNPETLQDALRQLYQDRVAYCVRYQHTYWKIGLYVDFVKRLENEPKEP